MKNVMLLFTLLLGSTITRSQDFVFADYSNVPTLLNPALIGSSCSPRVSIYGQSLSSFFSTIIRPSYRTMGLNYDMQFDLKDGWEFGVGYRYYDGLQSKSLVMTEHMIGASINTLHIFFTIQLFMQNQSPKL